MKDKSKDSIKDIMGGIFNDNFKDYSNNNIMDNMKGNFKHIIKDQNQVSQDSYMSTRSIIEMHSVDTFVDFIL